LSVDFFVPVSSRFGYLALPKMWWRKFRASVLIESERRLYLFLTRFLHANRYPLRWKTLYANALAAAAGALAREPELNSISG
jgi:hypothetical protein